MKKSNNQKKSERAKRWAKSAGVDLILDGSGYQPKGVKKWAETSWGRFGKTRDVIIKEKINGKVKTVGYREFGTDPSKDGRGKGESAKSQRSKFLKRKKK